MGYSQAPAFAAVVVLMVFAAANPVADAQLANLLNVTGILNCPSGTGLPVGPGIPGVPVRLNCSILGATVTLGQALTDVNGRFNISVPNLLGTLPLIGGPLLPCRVVVQLPLNQTVCPILNTATGILSAVPTLVSTIISPIFGLVANLVTNTFVNVGVGTGV